ncbi:MAG: HAMP domain-containing histidine kinase, partial [Bdellovibrionaceae bacterium]|nr:HAMP domain-containing histidine kinase [Pseudobdellovibrionaceae bacterium]
MAQMNGVLYISESFAPEPSWGVEHSRYSELQFPFFSHEPPVIVAHAQQSHFPLLYKLALELTQLKLETRLILFGNNLSADQLMELGNIYKIFYALPSDQIHDLESIIQKGLESSRQIKQNKVLVQLFKEQNTELKNISQELEDKIKKRQSHLLETNERLQQTNHKTNYLRQCLFAIHNAKSIDDLEKNVSDILAGPYHISWFRIQLTSEEANNFSDKKNLLNTYTFVLTDGEKKYGSVIYGRDSNRAFKREEKDFLDQISESISLCIDRLLQIERNKELQSLWQATFNAVSDPLCLIDQNYNLKIANKTFMEMYPNPSIEKNKAYFGGLQKEASENKSSPHLEFRIRDEKDPSIIYEVSTQSMMIDYQKCFFYVYHNISKQLQYERQLIESAKLAELGNISSSIAHELNNPLGGMLNFTQLIKMDLTGTEEYYSDIVEIEKGIQKCKTIVQNLLGFSRVDDYSQNRPLEIHEIIHRAILIVELRTRALGIKIEFENAEEKKIFIQGHFNQLAHAICNILQNSYESILEKRKSTNDYSGNIEILISTHSDTVKVDVLDDGKGIPADHIH